MSLIELAERAKKATGPDREIDLSIMCALDLRPDWLAGSGHLWIDRSGRYPVVRWADSRLRESPGNPSVDDGPRYTASLDAAMSLVPEGAGLGIERYWNRHGEAWSAEIRTGGVPDNPRKVFDCYDAATPALALVAAALRARAQQEQTI